MNRILALSVFLCTVLFSAVPSSSVASPPWWEGAPEDLPAAAAQTGKPVVLYFHSPNAAECIRMDEETWQPMNPIWADLQFLWMKLEPKKDAEFFKYWQINQVPQVVILDSEMRDQLRLRGFMNIDQVKESIQRIQRSTPQVYTTYNGGTVPANNPVLNTSLIANDPYQGHAYYEPFDSYRLLGSISNPPFSPIVQAASRIATKEGIGASPCLVVDSGQNGNSMFQIDISRSFGDIEQVVGRLRLRADLKATSSLGRVPVDVMALYIVRIDDVEDPSEQEQMYYVSLSDEDKDRWKEKETISGPINLRQNRAFVLLSTQTPQTSFNVDNITVDILPVDDLIPFVDTESRVASLSSLKENTSSVASSDDPDSFYESLSNRAKVRPAGSVSNNVSAPAATTERGDSDDEDDPYKATKLSDSQVDELAKALLPLNGRERLAAFKNRKIFNQERFRVLSRIMELEAEKK